MYKRHGLNTKNENNFISKSNGMMAKASNVCIMIPTVIKDTNSVKYLARFLFEWNSPKYANAEILTPEVLWCNDNAGKFEV